MIPRRAQTPIHIRSNLAAALLIEHTRDGRSQVEVIEDALRRLPRPEKAPLTPEQEAHLAEIKEIVRSIPKGAVMPMAAFDALEYDEFGDLR